MYILFYTFDGAGGRMEIKAATIAAGVDMMEHIFLEDENIKHVQLFQRRYVEDRNGNLHDAGAVSITSLYR